VVGAFAAGLGATAGLGAAAGLLGAEAAGFFCCAVANTDTAMRIKETKTNRTQLLLPSFQFISTLLAISPIILKSGTRLAFHKVSFGR
jgi:hypothetical protein